jgi:hypothetical protein
LYVPYAVLSSLSLDFIIQIIYFLLTVDIVNTVCIYN